MLAYLFMALAFYLTGHPWLALVALFLSVF